MKNKYLTKLLLLTVCTIWAIIIYKICKDVFKPGSKEQATYTTGHSTDKKQKLNDYQLHEYSRDPFMSILTDTAATEVIDTVIKTPKAIPAHPVLLPVYCGIVESKGSKTAILRYQENYLMLKEGEHNNKLTIRKIKKESILIELDGTNYTIATIDTVMKLRTEK